MATGGHTIRFSHGRTIVAFLVAPLVVPVSFWIVQALTDSVGFRLDSLVGAMLNYGAYAYLIAALLGLPAYLMFCRKKWVAFWQYAFGGAILGVVPAVAIATLGIATFRVVLLCLVCGVLGATVFRLINVPKVNQSTS